jgi:hypothetical protein
MHGCLCAMICVVNRFRTLPSGTDQSLLLNFMRVLSVCNNVMLMPDQKTGMMGTIFTLCLNKQLLAVILHYYNVAVISPHFIFMSELIGCANICHV